MSVRPLRNHPRIVVAVGLLAAVAAVVAWQRPGAIGQEPRKEVNPEALRHANLLSEAFNNAAEIAMPSVVTIHSSTKVRPVSGNRGAPAPGENPFKGTPFEDFFKGHDFDKFGGQIPQFRPKQGVGSGVIIDRSGIVLTNSHVVAGADKVIVHLADGREFEAEDIVTDERTDLAVLRIKGAGTLPAATLGDSDELEIGDWVIAIGNPFELEQTVSAGIISGKGRDLRTPHRASRTRFLQTDAAINPGNSGGPLVDLHGHVIGINTAIATNTGTYSGVGFAIPVNVAKWVTNQLINDGKVQRAYLGVNIRPVSPEMAEAFGAQPGAGALVNDVFPDTPAASAGLLPGDIILKFGDTEVSGPAGLQQVVERVAVDSNQKVEILRDGKRMTLSVVTEALPSQILLAANRGPASPRLSQQADVFEAEDLGLQLSNLNAGKAKESNLKSTEGVLIIGVEPNSVAFDQGLREGMVILKVGKKHVKSVDEFKAALAERSLEDGILLYVHARSGNDFVLLKD